MPLRNIKKRFTRSYFDWNDQRSQCGGFYYYFSSKDLQLSPSAKSSTSSLAKSFEVILSERKTPTLVHKPCQALYQCPYVKLIPISKPTLSNNHRIHLHAVICLLNSVRLVVKEIGYQKDKLWINLLRAFVEKSGWKRLRRKSNLVFGNAASR